LLYARENKQEGRRVPRGGGGGAGEVYKRMKQKMDYKLLYACL
jgi:hypothetical protein